MRYSSAVCSTNEALGWLSSTGGWYEESLKHPEIPNLSYAPKSIYNCEFCGGQDQYEVALERGHCRNCGAPFHDPDEE